MGAPAEQHSPAGAHGPRAPDFFIVGHHKSGTTALYEMLTRHPQIFMSEIKEPRYLAEDLRPRFPATRGHRLPQTLEEYLALFAAAGEGQLAGEATPAYLFSHTAAARIAEVQPDARVIAILREPAAFLHSLHLQLLRSHVETVKDLLEAIDLEGPRSRGEQIPSRSHMPQLLQYSDHVSYAAQLRRFHAVIPPERVLVLIYDDFQADNQGTLRKVLGFLGLDPDFSLEELRVKQTTRAMRNQQLDDLMQSVTTGATPASRAARATVKALAPRRLRRGAYRVVRRRGVLEEAQPLEDPVARELRRRYLGEVQEISRDLDRDLVALWGYDERA